VRVREELNELLAGSAGPETNVVSAFVELAIRLAAQQLLEAGQAGFLGGRGRCERREEGQQGSGNGYEPGRIRTAEGPIRVEVPQVRGATQPFRSSLMSVLEGNFEVLERLVTEMDARGLSTRDAEDAFQDATGELVISRSAVSGMTGSLGGLPGLRLTGPFGDPGRVPVPGRDLRAAPGPGGERSPARGLVHRLRGPKAPVAPGRR
jgi:transposase-like protein